MHRAKASGPFVAAVVVEEVVVATPAGELPPQPAASSDKAAAATTELRMSGRRRCTGRTVESRSILRVARKRRLSTAARR
jgi:hypothetical protein